MAGATRGGQKKRVQMWQSAIQKGFKLRLGLNIDTQKVGRFGTSNGGNTARCFFANCPVSANTLGLDVKLLNCAHIVMQVFPCCYGVKIGLFQHNCLETAKMFFEKFQWYCMPTLIHEVLIQGPYIVEWAP